MRLLNRSTGAAAATLLSLAAACGGSEPIPSDVRSSSDAGVAADVGGAVDSAAASCDTCTVVGPACDPLGSNRLGRCARDPATGCLTVSGLAPCAAGSPVCIAGTTACVMAGYVVAPNGNDANPGTVDRPFATIGHARDVVRTIDAAMTGDIAVYLRAGDYTLATSDCHYAGSATPSPAGLCFDERDSGTNGFTIRYTHYDALGSARLLGATAVKGWQPHAPGIVRAPWSGAPFDDLFENGVRAVKARTPNVNAGYGTTTTCQGPYFETLAGPGIDVATQFGFAATDLPQTTWNATDRHVQVRLFSGGNRFAGDTPNFNWSSDLDEVVGLDSTNHVITLKQAPSYTIPEKSRYFVQGDLSFLDAPGEYALADGYVYYSPRKSPVEAQEILAPQVKAIVQFCPRFQPGEVALPTQGSLCGHTALVHDIALSGLTLQASEFTSEYPDRTAGGADPSGLVYMENTRAITVKDCHLLDAGQSAIAMLYSNDSNVIYGNWIQNSGLSAIFVRTLATLAGQPVSGGHSIRNNKIEFVGMHETGQMGVHLEESKANTVAHNTVEHGPRALMGGAIDAPAPAPGNYFGYDALSFGAEDSADIAPFYFFSVCSQSPCSATDMDIAHMPMKSAEQLLIDTAAWHPASQLIYPRSLPPWGFYLDNNSSHWNVSNVVVRNVASSPVNAKVNLYNGGIDIRESNASWSSGFVDAKMDYDNIGLRPDFPVAFGNGGVVWTNDDAPTCSYSGSGWLYRHDAAVSDDYAGDEHYTNVAGDAVTCSFSGTEVRWATAASNNRGLVDVIIDGVAGVPVDTATPIARDQHVVYRKSGLPAGAHSITIALRADRPMLSNYLVIDAIGSK